jgi:carboxylesterase
MNIDDFRFIQCGKPLQALSTEDKNLLDPVDIRGQGTSEDHALLLLHGFSSSPAVYRLMIPELTTMYGRVVCPILPGHGDSIQAFSKVKALEWINASEKAFQTLKAEHKTIDIMGFSLGGLLGMHLSQREKINHLYLLAPALALKMNISLNLTWLKLLHWLGFERFRAQAGNLHTKLNTELAYRQLPLAVIIELLTMIKNFPVTSPTCPISLFLGCHDIVVDAQAVAKQLQQCSNIDIHWLKDSAHALPLESDRETIIACVKSNLQKSVVKVN